MIKKYCTKCGVEYPRTKEYYELNKRHKDGLSSWCRKCCIAKTINWQKKNPKEHCNNQKKHAKTFKGYVNQLMRNIKSRCTNKKHGKYKHYGGRGIKCCFTFDVFYGWLITNNINPKGLQIHRIDNDGDYTLDNIEFLTRSEHMKLHKNNSKLKGEER